MKNIEKLQIRTLVTIGLLFLQGMSVHAQQVIYSEDCGAPSATTLIQNYHGWQDTNVTYTGNGTCDVRTSSASSGYGQASGGGNVMINDTVKWFQISGLNTSAYSDVSLYCGLRKTTSENGGNFVVEASLDDQHWIRLELADSLPTGTGTSGWFRVHYTNVPSSTNLSLRFSNLASVDYRLDDITLVCGEEIQLETVSKPVLSPSGGTYYESQNVSITSPTENATIFYTTDGSMPMAGSLQYTGPISVNAATTIKAIAVKDGLYDSEVATASYVILDTNSLVTLPFDISSNSADDQLDIMQMPGFRGNHLGSSYADGSVKFEAAQANKATLVAHLDSAPGQLSFELKGKNGGSNPAAYEGVEFEVEESSDGQSWQEVVIISGNEISVDNYVRFSGYTLSPGTRFIRWKLLAAVKGNTQLNNIVITKWEGHGNDSTSVHFYRQQTPIVYPNPSKGQIYLNCDGEDVVSVSLLNMGGLLLRKWPAVSGPVSIDDLPSGCYLLEIRTRKNLVREKVIKY